MGMRSISVGLPAALLLLLLLSLFALRTPAAGALPASSVRTSLTTSGQQTPGLVVTATVGLQSNVCAPAGQLRVAPRTRVFYCYQATNTGELTLTTHTVEDTRSGLIWDRHELVLPPGATTNTVEAGLVLGSLADEDSRTQVTWTAVPVDTSLAVSATAQVTVQVVTAGVELTKTSGLAGDACGSPDAVAPSGADAHFCFVVANTGDLPLARHTLVDPSLDLEASFDYDLEPGQRLTVTHDTLSELGIEGSLLRRDVTHTVVNTAHYTATTADDATATGSASASAVSSATVSVAAPSVLLTATVGSDPAQCGDTSNLSLSNPNTQLYYCAILHNQGNVALRNHELAQPGRGLVSAFTRDLAPDAILSVTNALLVELGLPAVLGPVTVFDGGNLALTNFLQYTGTTSLDTGRPGETANITATAGASVFAGVDATATPTATPTRRPSESRPTNTPPPAPTLTPTPVSPLPTPDLAAQQAPSPTPTPTRSYQISLLETPTSPAVSPLAIPTAPIDVVATQEAEATLQALNLALTVAPESPLASPTSTSSPQPAATSTMSPTVQVIVVTATETPPPTATIRPIVLPPPAPTPDYLMFAARTVDSMMMTAAWIWFMIGSLIFFVVAGVLAGLSFRQNERRRFDLIDAGLVEDEEFLIPPPPPPQDSAADDWPDSLP